MAASHARASTGPIPGPGSNSLPYPRSATVNLVDVHPLPTGRLPHATVSHAVGKGFDSLSNSPPEHEGTCSQAGRRSKLGSFSASRACHPGPLVAWLAVTPTPSIRTRLRCFLTFWLAGTEVGTSTRHEDTKPFWVDQGAPELRVARKLWC